MALQSKKLDQTNVYPPVGPDVPVPVLTGPVGTSPPSGTSLPQLIVSIDIEINRNKSATIFFINNFLFVVRIITALKVTFF